MELYQQISIEDRFQPWSADFATTSDRTKPLVSPGLDSIEKVTLQMVVAPDDTLCPAKEA